MATEHVTLWLMTCLVLIGCSSPSSIVRTLGSEVLGESRPYNIESVGEKGRRPPPAKDVNLTSKGIPNYAPPPCDDLACPPFTVKADRGSYRIIYFPEAEYAKLNVVGKTMLPALFSTYDTLRHYYNKGNSEKRDLPMTAPVILRMDPGEPDGMFNPRNFTTFFYMNPDIKSPPTADDKDITVLLVNSYTLFVRTFSSYTVNYADWMRELLQLASDVEEREGAGAYKKGYYYFATYDSPYHINNRINEVQLLAL